ncbi:MAG TPA: hypothetical protein VMU64_10050 [Acidimicrobiales bacterium]|nr:hypothetical protein [Acidimicrobiales bacterium]
MLEAFPLCPGVVPVVGTLCNTVSGAAGNLAGSAAGAGIGAIFTEAARWVSSGAVWLIAQVGRAMSGTTSIDLDAGWFTSHEAVMASLAAAAVLPMVCCAAIQAIYRQSASMLLRTFLVHLPLSLLLTGVAVTLVRMALAVTDAMSATVLSSAGVDTANLFTGLFKFLIPPAVATAGAVPGFVVFLGSLVVSLAALTLWLELAVRAAAVSVAVLFLPLALAALVWPPIAHWCRRLADTLVALVLSKFVVAAAVSLAADAGAGGLGVSSRGNGGQFASVVTGIALLLIAILAPFTLLRLVPAVEAGAVAHFESTRHRVKSGVATPLNNGRNLAVDLAKNAGPKSEAEPADVVGTTSSTDALGAAASVGGVGTAGATGVASAVVAPGAAGSGGGTAVPFTHGDPAAFLAFSRIRPDGGAAVDDSGSQRPGSSSPEADISGPVAADTTDRSTRE